MKLRYDKRSADSILEYAKKLLGHTFREVYNWNISDIDISLQKYTKPKGGLGHLIEEQYFCYERNNSPEADFPEAGVELKVSPYEITKRKLLTAGERTVLCMIPNNEPIEVDFYKSHVWNKCKLILLIYYLRNREIKNADYSIDYVELFTPPKKDMAIILNDYKIITEKIMSGNADKLSESDTMYLGACTKGSTSKKSIQPQYYGDRPARRRAFCFKNAYMTYILREYLSSGNSKNEQLINNPDVLKDCSFEEALQQKIKKHIGKGDLKLAKKFGFKVTSKRPKGFWSKLSFRILGVKSNQAEELQKANIKVKTIRVEANGSIKESESFRDFKFKEIVKEKWNNADINDFFDTTKFLFIVFKKENEKDKEYVLKGCQMWNMPYDDLNKDVKKCWKETIKTIKDRVVIKSKKTKKGIEYHNNFPGKADNKVTHIRPHASKRYYKFKNGRGVGDNCSYGDELPDGRWMTKQCFFLNNDYLLKQLRDDLKS